VQIRESQPQKNIPLAWYDELVVKRSDDLRAVLRDLPRGGGR